MCVDDSVHLTSKSDRSEENMLVSQNAFPRVVQSMEILIYTGFIVNKHNSIL